MVLRTLLFISLLIPFYAKALCHQNQDGIIDCKEKASNQYQQFQDVLEWWSASPEQIRNAKCNNPDKITNEQMEDYIQNNKSGKLQTLSLHGMTLTDDAHLLALLEKLTTYDNIFDKLTNDYEEIKKQQKIFSLPENCHKVKCAVDHIFGKDIGVKLLYALDKYEMNMSEYTDKNFSRWEAKEIDLILEAMDDLPSTLFPFDVNKDLKHYKRGYGPSESTLANASINIFSPWDYESTESKMQTIVHEIGHNIGHHFDLDENKEWLDFSGWEMKNDVWTAHKSDAIVSKYGQTNPSEDFAESIVGYRYNPASLKKHSPEKYEYIKKYVFQGLEFDKEENCQIKKAYVHELLSKINSPLPKEKTYESCTDEIGKLFTTNNINLTSCLEEQRWKEALAKEVEQHPKYKDDARLQSILKSSAKSLDLKEKLTPEELMASQVTIVQNLANSFKNKFSTILGCETQKSSGWQNFINFNSQALKDEFTKAMQGEEINQFSYEICQKVHPKRLASCSDIAPFFGKMLPEGTDMKNLRQDAKGNCHFTK